jgi:hypothetical protein
VFSSSVSIVWSNSFVFSRSFDFFLSALIRPSPLQPIEHLELRKDYRSYGFFPAVGLPTQSQTYRWGKRQYGWSILKSYLFVWLSYDAVSCTEVISRNKWMYDNDVFGEMGVYSFVYHTMLCRLQRLYSVECRIVIRLRNNVMWRGCGIFNELSPLLLGRTDEDLETSLPLLRPFRAWRIFVTY